MASVVICTLFVKTLTVEPKVNRVAYGKQHHLKIRGMPCFDVNTKLGTAIKVSLGRPVNLKKMEARAGETIKKISTESSNKAAIDAYEKEME
ncbi:hypothetical protein DPMN_076094 [Dreissena polymorpha]|uniref:Uncharacterized protein n=1 Tax=Dreissena polymorpha TaxID=45954 RepID=A0A9D3YKW3_DREPO|nr:hypothetical protein DPMN_076094 [Dreissena polymorpha]